VPANTPDLDPIEMVFAKIKKLTGRAAAGCAITLRDALGSALDADRPDECANNRHAGWALPSP